MPNVHGVGSGHSAASTDLDIEMEQHSDGCVGGRTVATALPGSVSMIGSELQGSDQGGQARSEGFEPPTF